VAQAQYAFKDDIVSLAITPANAARFGDPAIDAQLKAASSFADTYLVSQFTLPLIEWDMELRRVVCVVAAYHLFNQYGYNPNAPQDKLVEKQYEQALSWLKQVKDKEIFPPYVDSGTVPTGVDEGGPFVVSDTPKGFTARGILPGATWTPGSGFNPRSSGGGGGDW